MDKKRVLIITYYWPPSGGSGVQRWLKMAKYLPGFGWSPVVYTPENPNFSLKDDGLDKDQVKGVEVIRTKIWDPGSLFNTKRKSIEIGEVNTKGKSLFYKLVVWVRGNIFIPDSKVFWVRSSIFFLSKYLRNNPVDVIITTGPPHSMHLIGLGLKKKLGIAWVADFRDPWREGDILNQLSVSKWAHKQHKVMERNVLLNADAIVAVGKRLGESFLSSLNKELFQKLNIITNGFDSEDFEGVEALDNKSLTLTYSGLLYSNRNPTVFWEVLNEFCKENVDFNAKLNVKIVGVVEKSVKDQLQQFEFLFPRIEFWGYVPHNESIRLCKNSTALILPVDNTKNQKLLTPGKLFEYLACNVPIIGFGGLDSDVNDLLTSTGHKPLLDYMDKDKIRLRLATLVDDFLSGGISERNYQYSQFSRKNIAKKMAYLLSSIC